MDQPNQAPQGNASQIDYSQLKAPESMSPNPNVSGGGLIFPQQPQVQKEAPPPPGPVYQQKPKSPAAIIGLIAFLLIILVLAILLFFSWKGWLKLGPLDQIWGGSANPAPSPSITTLASIPPEESNDAQRKKDLAQIQSILKSYYADNSKYPVSEIQMKISDQAGVVYQALVPTYADTLPEDPLAPQYYYGYQSDGQTFSLTAVLENTSDTSGTLHGSLNIYSINNATGE